MLLRAINSDAIAPPALSHNELARLAVFGEPSADWVFVEADTLEWQQWRRFCLKHIGRAPAAVLVFGAPPGRSFARYRGRSLPSFRPPGAAAIDRMRIASGEREEMAQ
ncbi:hypothetical protein [Ancylobacter sp. SL191]|uniref:hypothetical protein n=1 Tax=Ancylobacter sp. SL191 TaxID=2995166 RepID=UPI00226DD16D|nr:hypothetical protein [Ancylobacter sp. SL191]WAC25739.1 hypothetical protein OU996_11910 [Ancylobacter sp. SL191]